MGGRGSGSGGGAAYNRELNARKHSELAKRTLDSKSGSFNEFRFRGLDWWKDTGGGKSSAFLKMNRVSEDGDKVVVHVDGSHLDVTQYGNIKLQLDRNHAVYLKTWAVEPHRVPHHEVDGFEVMLDRKFFSVKETKYSDMDFPVDSKALSFDTWVRTARQQERAGNHVSMHVEQYKGMYRRGRTIG